MKKFTLILILTLSFNLAQGQESSSDFIGYLTISGETADKVQHTFRTELLNCNLPDIESDRRANSFWLGQHFRKYLVKKYKLTYSSGPMSTWYKISREGQLIELYEGSNKLYKKTTKVLIIPKNDFDFKCIRKN